MRRLIVAAIVLVLLLQCQNSTRVAAHTGTWQVNGALGVNLRTGPGGTYHRLYTMPNGRLVKARGHRGNWLYLTDLATGRTGWAWLAYFVQVSGSSSSTGSTSGSGQICLTNYWNEFVCSSADTGNAIRYWAAQYGLGWYWLAATAACESSFHLYVVNSSSGVSGLFQFEPETFWSWSGVDLWDAWDQSRIAAKMFAAGEARQFYCAVLIGYA